jgi:hypothetical protein
MKGCIAALLLVSALVALVATRARAEGEAPDGPGALDEQIERRIGALTAGEPTVAEVRAAAVRYAGLAPERARGWARRSRLAALAPEVSARALRAVGRDEGLKITGGETDYQKIDAGDDLILEVRATWDLRRLVFDNGELRAAREGARQAAQRRQLETEVTRLYYERRRGQIDWILDPPSNAAERATRIVEMEELTAQLDALTGGYLSRELARRAGE